MIKVHRATADEAVVSSVHQQNGFTLVEALVAAFVLVVGVLGTVALVSAANDQTARTLGEDAGGSLAREVTEVARQVPFAALHNPPAAASALAALVPGSGAASAASWPVQRRNRQYTVTVSSCVVRAMDAGECFAPGAWTEPGGSSSGSGAVVELLGLVGVGLDGGVPNALCGVFGPDFDLDVLGLAGVSADTCQQAGAQAHVSGTPPALARLQVTVSWNDRGRTRSLSQVALVADREAAVS